MSRSLKDLHTDVQQAQRAVDEAAERFHRAVAKALGSGRSAVSIARELGVTRSRVYQWRRKVE